MAICIFAMQAFSQKAYIAGQFDRQDVKRRLLLSRPMQLSLFSNSNDLQEIMVSEGTCKITLDVPAPEIMYLTSYVNDSIEFKQPLFLKSGYKIMVDCKTKNGITGLAITGIGAKDNQPLALAENVNFANYQNDTLPGRILTDILSINDKNRMSLEQYKTLYKPSDDFIKSWNTELQYNPIKVYCIYAKQRKLFVKMAYQRNEKYWNEAMDQLLVKAPLINQAALPYTAYRIFLKMLLVFNSGQFHAEEAGNRDQFMKTWYAGGRDTGSRSFANDDLNIPNQKFIEKNFTGAVKEYMYAWLFKMALEAGKTANLDSVYADFLKAYPFSKYKKIFEGPVLAVTKKSKEPGNKKIIFEKGAFQTWRSVLEHFAGKTVLVDMWGTWCGPCREDIRKYSADIKNYFKDSGLEYLYIANNDLANEKTWESLITYYNMEGHHILAADVLTRDLMDALKLQSYPTYVIIHKDGSYAISKAGSLEEKEIIISELEAALK